MPHELRPQNKLKIIGIFFIVSWFIGTVLIHYFEREQNWSYFDAFYFTVITTATIGFGDLVPHSIEGKCVTMLYAIFYVPLFLYTMTLLFQTEYKKFHKADEMFSKTLRDTEENVKEILNETRHKKK
ncbi:two pore domain potassium channel family protein [Candidatus Gracilibacteria bacterium]|nr:two pore domain potassium channel family protein [Candidatus Gracilibacteria bacterium]